MLAGREEFGNDDFMTLLLLCYSQAMKIHISETTFNCLQNANYRMKQRGSIEIKVTE